MRKFLALLFYVLLLQTDLHASFIHSLCSKLQSEISFMRNLSKISKENIFILKNDFLEFCSCSRFNTLCSPIGCENFKIIISEFFENKFDKISEILFELKKENVDFLDEFILEEKVRTLVFLSVILESYLIQILDQKRGVFSNFKVGFEIALFIYDLSRFSTDRLFWVLEKYHQELLMILNKYVEDIDDIENFYQEDSIFWVLKKIKEKKPYLLGVLSLFFIYGIYKYKNMNYQF